MSNSMVRLAYWGGWAAAGFAVLYKLLMAFNVALPLAGFWIFPRHFWQLSFLLFLACIASESLARAKSA